MCKHDIFIILNCKQIHTFNKCIYTFTKKKIELGENLQYIRIYKDLQLTLNKSLLQNQCFKTYFNSRYILGDVKFVN